MSAADEYLALLESENPTVEDCRRAQELEQIAERTINMRLQLASDRLLDPLSEIERKGKNAMSRAELHDHLVLHGRYHGWKQAVIDSRRLEVARQRLVDCNRAHLEADVDYQRWLSEQKAKEATQ